MVKASSQPFTKGEGLKTGSRHFANQSPLLWRGLGEAKLLNGRQGQNSLTLTANIFSLG
ncbi:MAG: hypothetical protein JWR38_3506 [Mucilaginibacter sp.]|nr:hypothetical protein [Mucilaginibacter sp.]